MNHLHLLYFNFVWLFLAEKLCLNVVSAAVLLYDSLFGGIQRRLSQNMSELMRILFLYQVPYEVLNKKFRTAQKIIDREVSHVLTTNSDLSNIVKKESVKVSDVTGILDGVIEKLQVLKRKVMIDFIH